MYYVILFYDSNIVYNSIPAEENMYQLDHNLQLLIQQLIHVIKEIVYQLQCKVESCESKNHVMKQKSKKTQLKKKQFNCTIIWKPKIYKTKIAVKLENKTKFDDTRI